MKRIKKPMWRYNQKTLGDAETTMRHGILLLVRPLGDGSFQWNVQGHYAGKMLNHVGNEKARERAQHEALRCYRNQVDQG